MSDYQNTIKKFERWATIYREAQDTITTMQKRIDKLEDFANAVVQWSDAYPKDVYSEPTPEQVDKVCRALGFSIANISAMVLRNFTTPWGKMARQALTKKEKK